MSRASEGHRRSRISSYRDLIAWHKGMELVRLTYKLTAGLPREEQYGLKRQMRDCSISVPSNTAEGWGRFSTADFIRFLRIARGSACELSTEAEACVLLGYDGNWAELIDATEEVGRVLNGLIRSLPGKSHRRRRRV